MSKSSSHSKLAIALLSLSWALHDGLFASCLLRAKLAVHNSELISALAALTASEWHQLQCEIRQLAEAGVWPGPLKFQEVCTMLDKIVAQFKTTGAQQPFSADPSLPGAGMSS